MEIGARVSASRGSRDTPYLEDACFHKMEKHFFERRRCRPSTLNARRGTRDPAGNAECRPESPEQTTCRTDVSNIFRI